MTRSPVPPRRVVRLGLIGAAAAALVAGALLWSGPAHAATASAVAPAYQHPYRHGAVPSLDTQARMQAYQAAHPQAVPADSANNLRYGGGVDGIGVTTGKP